jgi:ElaB/YqjD/DUF883 family membrane-anchored ribosome-binding protein
MSTPHAQSSKAEHVPDDIAQQIETLRADVMRLAATMSDDVPGGISKAGRQISRSGREARATATTAVLDHPLIAIGIVTSLGLLLGLMSRKG